MRHLENMLLTAGVYELMTPFLTNGLAHFTHKKSNI